MSLNLTDAPGPLTLRWLDIAVSSWRATQSAGGGGALPLAPPGDGPWAVLVRVGGEPNLP